MNKNKEQNKLNELAIQQNLLLWHLSQSMLDIENKLKMVISPSLSPKKVVKK